MPLTVDIERLFDQKYRDISVPFAVTGSPDFSVIATAGLLASRPAAAFANRGFFYLATDTYGGTLYLSDGATWTQAAKGVLEDAAGTTATSRPAISVTSTRTQLPNTTCLSVFLKAAAANTQPVYLGDVTVTSAGGGNVFTQLNAAEGLTIDLTNPSSLYAAASGTQTLYIGLVA